MVLIRTEVSWVARLGGKGGNKLSSPGETLGVEKQLIDALSWSVGDRGSWAITHK